ncbi:MAG: damage-inducible protein CinA [Rhizobiales bacterium NRL2]|mgnify:CR=1 FL=1|jgi:nicotinamide-nucleotide amidase|nr:MAG: damage-inducible protein CinA [Rhizobiales bacterium NRL2]
MSSILAIHLPDRIEAAVHAFLDAACDQGLRVATAESCTGGLLASLLTDIEGSSHAFECGLVVYTDKAKRDILAVPAAVLERHGAVAEATAIAMAEGAMRRTAADIAMAVTGFAGPAGVDDEEGLVHFACARKGRETRHREEHFGPIGRGQVRVACIEIAIAMMSEMLK